MSISSGSGAIVSGDEFGRGQRHLGLKRQYVGWDLEPDRARAAVAQLAERLVDEPSGLGRVVDAGRPFGQPFQDAELVRNLVQQAKAAADQIGSDLAADAQHRRVRRISGGECGRGVEHTGSRHHGIGTDLAAGTGIAERHVGGTLLVARMDHPERLAGVVEGHEQRVVLHTGQREDRIHIVPAQHLDQCAAARHPRHRSLRRYSNSYQ